MKRARFALGQIVATPGALKLIAYSQIDPWALIDRHVTGDWGDLDDDDKRENDDSLRHGFRLLSAYRTAHGERLWVVTEADRSATTLLLPAEY